MIDGVLNKLKFIQYEYTVLYRISYRITSGDGSATQLKET